MFCWCPPGKFKMGDKERVAVTLSRGFWMGKYGVTQAQYQFVMGKNPSEWKGAFLPVETVSWTEATEFCEKLTKLEREAGRLPEGWEYRLPTEAQWEYACRAGTQSTFSFGDDAEELGRYAWSRENAYDIGENYAHEVGKKLPNAWKLHDMHGNVWEWCRDWYTMKLPGGNNPEVTSKTAIRVIRGGSWYRGAEYCRSAFRRGGGPGGRSLLGFRVALVSSGQDSKKAVSGA